MNDPKDLEDLINYPTPEMLKEAAKEIADYIDKGIIEDLKRRIGELEVKPHNNETDS